MRAIRRRTGNDFICEFIPGLDAFDPARFELGLFRFGLPAVYQMVLLFDAGGAPQSWSEFSAAVRRRFAAVDDEYVEFVRTLWTAANYSRTRAWGRAS